MAKQEKYRRNDSEQGENKRDTKKPYAERTRDKSGEREYQQGERRGRGKPKHQDGSKGAPRDHGRNFSPEEDTLVLFGRNPVKEAIKSGRSIDKIFVLERNSHDGSMREILALAKERKLVVVETRRDVLNDWAMRGAEEDQHIVHQGIVALLPPVSYVSIADILREAKEAGRQPFVLVLDSLQDPQNLGAILRTASAAGVDGIIMPKRRAAPITGTVVKASAGAALRSRIARVSNLSQAIEELKKAGLWIAGACMEGDAMYGVKLEGAIGLVIGSEGEGISPLLRKNCDFLVSIPMNAGQDSLNAASAAAVLVYEKRRQDGYASL